MLLLPHSGHFSWFVVEGAVIGRPPNRKFRTRDNYDLPPIELYHQGCSWEDNRPSQSPYTHTTCIEQELSRCSSYQRSFVPLRIPILTAPYTGRNHLTRYYTHLVSFIDGISPASRVVRRRSFVSHLVASIAAISDRMLSSVAFKHSTHRYLRARPFLQSEHKERVVVPS